MKFGQDAPRSNPFKKQFVSAWIHKLYENEVAFSEVHCLYMSALDATVNLVLP